MPARGLPPIDDLGARLDAWVDAGLLAPEQADAIADAERRRAAAAAPPRGALTPGLEAMVYLGAALVVGAAVAALSQVWDDLPVAARLGLLLVTAVALAVAGARLRGAEDPALGRAASFAWALSSVAIGGFAALLMADGFDRDGPVVAVAIGAAAAPWSIVLWRLERRALQVVLVMGAVGTLVVGTVAWAGTSLTGVALVVVALGAAAVALAWVGVLEPSSVATAVGVVAALYAPLVMGPDHPLAAALVVAVVGAAVVAVGVALDRTLLLGLGLLGLLVGVPQVVVRVFGGGVGTSLALMVLGGIVLAVAVRAARRRTGPREPRRAPARPPARLRPWVVGAAIALVAITAGAAMIAGPSDGHEGRRPPSAPDTRPEGAKPDGSMPAAPAVVTAVVEEDGLLEVGWQPVADDGIVGYRVDVCRAEDRCPGRNIRTVSTAATAQSATVALDVPPALRQGTYLVAVRAATATGLGDPGLTKFLR